MWKVTIIESERGWGQKVDGVKKFESYEEAKQFQIEFNKENTALVAPDWYIVARDPVFDSTEVDNKLKYNSEYYSN